VDKNLDGRITGDEVKEVRYTLLNWSQFRYGPNIKMLQSKLFRLNYR